MTVAVSHYVSGWFVTQPRLTDTRGKGSPNERRSELDLNNGQEFTRERLREGGEFQVRQRACVFWQEAKLCFYFVQIGLSM